MPSDDWMLEYARKELARELTIGNTATVGSQEKRQARKLHEPGECKCPHCRHERNKARKQEKS